MADINYKSTYGKDNWVSQAEFDGLDLSAQEEGTVYEIVGEVGESDIDFDLQSKINAKMDAPTASGTSGQVLTMGADGNARWQNVASADRQRHCVQIIKSDPDKVLYFWVDTTETITGEIENLVDLVDAIMVDKAGSLEQFFYPCTGRWGELTDNIVVTGCLFTVSSDQPTINLYLSDGSVTDSLSTENLGTFSDTIITL